LPSAVAVAANVNSKIVEEFIAIGVLFVQVNTDVLFVQDQLLESLVVALNNSRVEPGLFTAILVILLVKYDELDIVN